MIRSTSHLVIALLAVGIATTAIHAQTTKPAGGSLQLALSASATEVDIGAEVKLTAKLSTDAAEGMTGVPDLVFDDRSLSFLVGFGGKDWRWSRWMGKVERPSPIVRKNVTSSSPLEATVDVLLPEAGDYTLKAVYKGMEGGTVESAPVKVTVKARDGNDRLLLRFDTKHGGQMGSYTVELYPEYTMGTVLHMLGLANDGYFDGSYFHRVIADFMSQGGDPNSKNDNPMDDGTGGPGYTIPAEFDAAKFANLSHTVGVLSMARSNHPDSAGSQFFVCSKKATFLDNKYTAFGKVVEGVDVAEKCNKIATKPSARGENSVPVEPLQLVKVEVVAGKSAGTPGK